MDDVTPPTQQPNQTPDNEPTEQPTPPEASTPTTPEPSEEVTPTDNAAPAEAVTSGGAVSGGSGKKPGWGRRLLFVVVILALLGGAVWAATRLNTPEKPAATVTKKDVPLIRVGVQEPTSPAFYPKIEANNLDYDVTNQVFEGLTRFQDKTRVVPALATSWSNPDNNTWVFKLRQGVKFHNGHSFNAQAVKDALEDGIQNYSDITSEFNDTIKTISVVDNYTVKIVTSAPDPLLLNKLTDLWIYDAKGKVGDSSSGTGPYIEKSGTQITKEGVKLVAFDGYYGGHVYTREVDIIHYVDDASMLKALQAKQLELASLDDASLIAKAGSGFTQYDPEGLRVSLLIPNSQKSGPLANKTVRQAIYTALDPLAFAKNRGLIGATAATQPVPPSIPGFDPAIKRPTTDVAKAKALLAQAGYPNGFSIKFTYFVNSKDIAQELQKQLEPLGIKLTMDEETDGPTLSKIAYGGQTDLFFISLSSDLIDSSDVYQGILFQQKNYSSAEVSKLYSEATTTLDQAKRLKLEQQLGDAYMADYGSFPLYNAPGFTFALSKNLHLEQQTLTTYIETYFNGVYAE